MNIKNLKAFKILANTLHFGKASRECNMTVSTLSRIIQRLEYEVGEQLFIRDRREVEITPAGEKLYNFATKTLKDFENLRADIHSKDPKYITGEIMIYTTATGVQSILPAILRKFKEIYPSINFCLETGLIKPAFTRLAEGEIDFIVAIMNKRNIANFRCQKILEVPLLFVVPKDSDYNHPTACPIIISRAGTLSEMVNAYFDEQGIVPNIYGYVEGHEAILSMVAAGFGGAILPEIVVNNSYMRKNIKIIPLEKALPIAEDGLFMKNASTISPIKQIFWDFVSELDLKKFI